MGRIRRIHFIGIGGSGMGGIAEVLLHEGYHISGSDQHASAATNHLAALGAQIFIGHRAEQVIQADVVVLSSAIPENNPERQKAAELSIPIIRRAQMLAELMRFRHGIAVAGTHGKTTTTSLIASICKEALLDPTFVIGGLLTSTGSHARLGTGRYLVAEADESDASFLYLQPMVSVITNIEADHMETYAGDFSRLTQTFLDFIHRLPFYGRCILCLDDPVIRDLLPQIARPTLTYGFHPAAECRLEHYRANGATCEFDLHLPEMAPFRVKLNLPGRHNALNATAALAVAWHEGIDLNAALKALAEFGGVGRRFQRYPDLPLAQGSAMLVDDYGHHPSEIAATLAAAKESWPNKRIVMIFQPHRYTRTHDLKAEFVQVLARVDQLILLDVYSAGEAPIAGADSQSLAQAIAELALPPIFVSDRHTIPHVLAAIIQPNDLILTQGAGDITKVAQQLQLHWAKPTP